MKERLENDQIAQRIIDTNSDIKRYLTLAPSLKFTPSQPKTSKSDYTPVCQSLLPHPALKL